MGRFTVTAMNYAKRTVSVVVPCYNSEHTACDVACRSAVVLKEHGFNPEVILVNDCSSDDTWSVISSLSAREPWATSICFAKNYGQHNALLAGLRYSNGEYVIGIDDDLQTPPEEIPKLLELLDGGHDLVFGIPSEPQYQTYRSLGSKFNRWCACYLTDRPTNVHTSSFWGAKRFAVEEAVSQHNPMPQIQSALFEATSNVGTCVVQHDARSYGTSGYTFSKLIRQWSRLASYSSKPFELLAKVSLAAVASTIFIGLSMVTGFSEMAYRFEMLLLCTIIMLCLVLDGLYLGRAVQILRGKPPYVIKEVCKYDVEE